MSTPHTTSVYIAGRYEARERLRVWRDKLRELGCIVLSTWLDETPERDAVDAAYMRRAAVRDVSEIALCTSFILDTLDDGSSGGREVELGLALRNPKIRHCIVVGPKRNVFHELCHHFQDWPALIAWSQDRVEQMARESKP